MTFLGKCLYLLKGKPDLRDCVDHTVNFIFDLKDVLDKLDNDQDLLDHDFIDEVLALGHSVTPFLESCEYKKAEAKWTEHFPEDCISILGTLAHDTAFMRDHEGQPVQRAKDLLKYKKDLKTAV